MSRTSGPGAPPPNNRWPERPRATAAPYPDQGYQQQNGGYPPQAPGYPAQQGFAPPPQQQGYHYPDLGHGGDSYSQPSLGTQAPPQQYQQPASAPAYEAPRTQPPQQQYGAPSYAPQFEPYVPPTQPAHRPREARIVAPEQGYPQPELRGATYDQHPHWNTDPAAQSGYGQPQGYADPYAQNGYAADPGYAATGYPQQGYPQSAAPAPAWPAQEAAQGHYAGGYDEQQGQHGYEAPQSGYPNQPGYPQQNAYASPAGYPVEPSFEVPSRGQPAGRGDGYGVPAAVEQQDHEYDPDEVEYEDEERGGRGRMVKIAAALVGAIGIGGALAYGYTMVFDTSSSGKPPVVRSAGAPAKVRPIEPGGKRFAHTDSKVLGRLDDGSQAAPARVSGGDASSAGASDDDGSPRKVTTMVVRPDGSIVQASTSPPPGGGGFASAASTLPQQPPQRVAGVPGLTIVDGFGGRPPPSLAPASMSPPPAAARPAAPVVITAPAISKPVAIAKPTVIAKAEPRATVTDANEDEPIKPAVKKVVKKPVANDAFGTTTTSTRTAAAAVPVEPAAGSGGSAGYVAVLASIPTSTNSRIEALKQFADLQQRYPSQLQSKSPEVQSAQLAKGSFDRLLVGPPGSRQQANSLCEQLKAAGYGGCWIKSY